jgi:hypothetical protein
MKTYLARGTSQLLLDLVGEDLRSGQPLVAPNLGAMSDMVTKFCRCS